ncbi:MAG: hypothetical protein HGA47_06280 [Zoogloea sp.]|nr:hypothetical protein [Zoogloea sp.]
MKHYVFRSLHVYFRINEEEPGVFMPAGDIEYPETGETAPVALRDHVYSMKEAIAAVILEARRRIIAGAWRN